MRTASSHCATKLSLWGLSFLLGLVICASPAPTLAATYYLDAENGMDCLWWGYGGESPDPGGDWCVTENTEGSAENPWQTLAFAMDQLAGTSGDTLIVAPGTYSITSSIYVTAQNLTIQGSGPGVIFDGSGGGAIIDEAHDGLTIQNVRFENFTVNPAITVSGVSNVTIVNNLFVSCSIGVSIENAGADILLNDILLNTFDGAGVGSTGVESSNAMLNIIGNIFLNYTTGVLSEELGFDNLISYNCFYGCTMNIDDGGTSTTTGNLYADPLLVGGGDYHLSGDSPCIDAVPSAAVGWADGAEDMDGEPRINNTAVDMGADECYMLTVTTEAATDITLTAVTGNGTIIALGYLAPTQHGVCWSTSVDPTTADSCTTEGVPAGIGPFTSSITGLTPNTIYHYRAYATNSEGTVYGEDVMFIPRFSGSGNCFIRSLFGD